MAEKYFNDVDVDIDLIGEMPPTDTSYIDANGKIAGYVVIPDGVVSIENNKFSSCTNLLSVTIPSSVTTVGNNAFTSCTSLKSITIPSSVTSMGTGIFQNCTSLTSVTISNSVTSVGSAIFKGCTSLISVTIPNGVTSIASGAFSSCTSLTSVTIPSSVTGVGTLFSGCTALTKVVLGQGFNCNNLNISASELFTAETLVAMLVALADRTGETTQYTLTIGTTNRAKLTEEQIKIATDKNWNIV